MALDGIFLHYLCSEINEKMKGAKVDKVFQPSKEELVFLLRSREGNARLYISSRANSPRVNFTQNAPDNPANPPMLCMLLRKKLCGCTFEGISQYENDRVAFLKFTGTDELGDPAEYTLCVEIMAKHSNIILVDKKGVIIDSVKRVDSSKSSYRVVLPGEKYILPPKQNKLMLKGENVSKIITLLKSSDKILSKSLLNIVQGLSPLSAREIAFEVLGNCDVSCTIMSGEEWLNLEALLQNMAEKIAKGESCPQVVFGEDSKPRDFSFMPLNQYKGMKMREYGSCSELLDFFYTEKDRAERIHQRAQDLFRLLSNTIERVSRRINMQTAELNESEDREKLRIYAELISANQYRLGKGAQFYDVENYYDDNKPVRIPCSPALSPIQNSQKYFKEYKKAFVAEKKLTELIAEGKQELQYVQSLMDILSRCSGEADLSALREELIQAGYIKMRSTSGRKARKEKPLAPMRFVTDTGKTVFVGRNNLQNDKLTLKTAAKNDMWFHLKNAPGSHVILETKGEEPEDIDIFQAATLASWFSSARESSKTEIDYTQVKNVKKPSGSKPGMVIYDHYSTIIVDPDSETVKKLSKQ